MPFPDRLSIPDEVLAIARKLEGAGHETWCVGGAIRDNLLGFANQDFDLATAARPDVVLRLFRRTVPVGIDHGTVAVLGRGNTPHEVTTFRRDVTTDGRHAVVAFGVSLDDDLARRDFTINAIAYHPLRHEWRDPFGGSDDLDRRLIRAVGDPAQRFREDYLRILRALRFAARFGFTIDPPTWDAAKAQAAGLRHLSAERVRDEWFKGLRTALHPSELVRLWRDVGAVEIWLPELVRGAWYVGADGEAPLDRIARRDPVLMTAYLSLEPEATLRRLRASNAEIERARRLGANRGALPDATSDVAVRRWLSVVGSDADDLLWIAAAEGRGTEVAEAVARVLASHPVLSLDDLAVDGDDLRRIGIAEGPLVGRVLRGLLDEVIEWPEMNQKAALLDRARSLASLRTTHRAPRTDRPGAPRTRGGKRKGRGK